VTLFKKRDYDWFDRWGPALFMMAVIFLSSSTKGSTINETAFNTERSHIFGHLVMFFFLCVSFYKGTKNVFKAILFSAFYAFFDEFHQKYTLGRSPSFFDVKIDIIGATAAGLCLWKLQHLLPKKLKSWLAS